MIFVTVGYSTWDFTRLVKAMDLIAKIITEDIIVQVGNTSYTPKNVKYFKFNSQEEIDYLYNEARLIVSHAGIGTLINSIKHKKPIIVMPRMKQYNEHLDDHQVEIALKLEKERYVKVVWNANELKGALLNSIYLLPNKKEPDEMIDKIKIYLSKVQKK
jgi:beta-1,4-N-acetylglucosaminyltransferase